ncbi:MAG: hypothetical protein PF448_13085 [Bacteroidales bacterium]|jgi:hypothetical protein|nr:hypothetical protein [Bacteroidales bacterium]
MKTLQIDKEKFRTDYMSVLQHHAYLSDTQNLWGDIGRAAGKSTHIIAPRLVRIVNDLPRAPILLMCSTYVSLLDNILPAILSYMNKHYVRGYHFEYQKKPPKFFKQPYRDVSDWRRTISFPNGAYVRFGSMDRPESVLGSDFVHVITDELLRIKESEFIERVIPTLRADRSLFGHSPYFGGITGFSSTPNLENDHDWWLAQEENMDKELIDKIMDVALRVDHAKYYSSESESEKERKKHQRFAKKWSKILREKRKGATTYLKGSSFSNILILGTDYIRQQIAGSKSNLEKVLLSIFGIRPNAVKEMFFGKFNNSHIYTDSYKYNHIDVVNQEMEFVKSSRDLKYGNAEKPILAGFDPGHFMSIVFAQEKTQGSKETLRVLKNMYVTHPQQHFELAAKINDYFQYHSRKKIYLYYDRAANQCKRIYRNNQSGRTDARILKRELEAHGWRVELMDLGRETIFHYLHYTILNILFGEHDQRTPKMAICQNECEELISSIRHSPLKRKDGRIQLDKKSEDELDLEDQAFWSTQIATAFMYLLYGLYEKHLPANAIDYEDYSGL